MENKYRVKIGEIELELEGETDYIEKERSIFFENVLPQALEITRYIRPAVPVSPASEEPKKRKSASKLPKTRKKTSLQYSNLSADDLNLKAYPAIKNASATYIASEDVIGQFIDETVEYCFGNDVSASTVYKTYKVWCDESGNRVKSQTYFGRKLAGKKYTKAKKRNGIFYENIKLKIN
ncbi:primase-like DNA-binding domain-containing protein [Treponema endosymbiont of Eucomonympha sp.]|uniref:primase-like DNA-binding domain-containing protein n=1 Tax=Treponema endosymbiont of Eucomonympha sp. TaxID=1580831 RepID=UPI00075126E0|nr:primase-like DNA-binding domain-containing protein [Treponema endosymbiont of Eucomonympha sp.]